MPRRARRSSSCCSACPSGDPASAKPDENITALPIPSDSASVSTPGTSSAFTHTATQSTCSPIALRLVAAGEPKTDPPRGLTGVARKSADPARFANTRPPKDPFVSEAPTTATEVGLNRPRSCSRV